MDSKKWDKYRWLLDDIQEELSLLHSRFEGEKYPSLNDISATINKILDNTFFNEISKESWGEIAEYLGLIEVWTIGYLPIYSVDIQGILKYLEEKRYKFLYSKDFGFYTTSEDNGIISIRQLYIPKDEFENRENKD